MLGSGLVLLWGRKVLGAWLRLRAAMMLTVVMAEATVTHFPQAGYPMMALAVCLLIILVSLSRPHADSSLVRGHRCAC